MIGTVERYPDGAAARTAMTIVLAELNSGKARISCGSITVAQLCDHFEQRELTPDNTCYSTKKTYQAYLNRRVFLTGGTTNWLRSEQYKLSLGFDACLWRKVVAPKSEV